jgi:hypothetical protein
MPWRRQQRDLGNPVTEQRRRRQRQRTAKAIAGERCRLTQPGNQRHQPFGDHRLDAERRGFAPIDRNRPQPARRQPGEQRIARRQVEHMRRVDQRGDDDDQGPAAAMILQADAADAGNFAIFAAGNRCRRALIAAQPGQHRPHPHRIVGATPCHHVQKHRQGVRTAATLRRNIDVCYMQGLSFRIFHGQRIHNRC